MGSPAPVGDSSDDEANFAHWSDEEPFPSDLPVPPVAGFSHDDSDPTFSAHIINGRACGEGARVLALGGDAGVAEGAEEEGLSGGGEGPVGRKRRGRLGGGRGEEGAGLDIEGEVEGRQVST
ncbi:hypothetical protein AB1Y20_021858 [Prymnesium parvum]|uniref:Uncharacterized protein n=1 Tax=Prymnesium parvum TaxID=97485 RepID=A0AB34JLF5_PRYPA